MRGGGSVRCVEGVTIRPAGPGDLDELMVLGAEYCAADGHEFDADTVRAGFTELLTDDVHGVVLVADVATGRHLEGYAVVTWGWSVEIGGLDVVLDELYVRLRGQGVGTTLIDEVERVCRDRGVKRIFLETERAERARPTPVRPARLRGRRLDLDVEGVPLKRAAPLLALVPLLSLLSCGADPPTAIVGVDVAGCDPGTTHGTGVVVDDDLVLTSAHTLRGARSITISHDGHAVDATIVAFDPELDLAYLRADLPGIRPIPVDSDGIEPGEAATAWVVRGDDAVAVPVTIRRRIHLNTEDIYVDADTTRPGIELHADIQPGDSGGPVVVDGGVAGLLWARSKRTESLAYAIDPDRGSTRIDAQLGAGDLGDVDLTRCR